MSTKFKLQVEQEIEVTDEQLLELVKTRVKQLVPYDYKLEEGKLYYYDRVGWNDYAWVEVPRNTIHPDSLLALEQANKAVKSLTYILETSNG